jgi:hypothetical protein
MTFQMLTDAVLKNPAPLIAAVAFIAGLLQYRQAQKWKRAEWVAKEMKEFYDNPVVHRAMLMIDWEGRTFAFPEESPETGTRLVRVTDDVVTGALRLYQMDQADFTTDEVVIRDTFDELLDGMEMFASFRAAGLVTAKDIKPYLAYWIEKIRSADTSGEPKRLVQLRAYIQNYGYSGIQKMFQDYRNDPLTPKAPHDWWKYRGSR